VVSFKSSSFLLPSCSRAICRMVSRTHGYLIDISNQTFTQESASPVLGTAKLLPRNPTTNPKRKDTVSRNARVTKRRTSKVTCTTKSQSGDASPRKAPIGLEQERGVNLPNITWQTLVQQDLMTESPLKPPNSSKIYPNYVYEYSAAPYTPKLPPIAPLLVAIGLESHRDRDNNQSEVIGEYRSPQQ
jgi:hypothetical protein